MKKKNITVIVLFVFLVTCGIVIYHKYSGGSSPVGNKNIAGEKAIAYVEDKYGIKAEVTDVRFDTHGGLAPLEGGGMDDTAMVDMEYDGKQFLVWIDVMTDKGYDNYQYEEITQAFEDKINSAIPDGTLVYISCWSSGYHDHSALVKNDGGMVTKEAYYDGKDVSKVMDNANVSLIIYYVDTEFSDCGFFHEIEGCKDLDIELVSFDSEEELERAKNTGYYFDERDYLDNALHITDRWEFHAGKGEHLGKYNIKDAGYFLYYMENDEEAEMTVSTMGAYTVMNGHKFFRDEPHEPVTPGYILKAPDDYFGHIIIFYPTDDPSIPKDKHVSAVVKNGSDPDPLCKRSGDHFMIDISHTKGEYNGEKDYIKFCLATEITADQ